MLLLPIFMVNDKKIKMKYHQLCLFSILFIVSCQTTEEPLREIKEYTIEQFLGNEAVFGSSFSYDESRLLIGSNKTGIYNAYSIDLNTMEKTALTSSEDRSIRPVSYFPSDDRFLYISDNNGDEIDHLFVQNVDGSFTELTPAQGAKSDFAGWAKDHNSFFFISNERNPQFFDLYEMQIEDFSSKRIYENNDGMNIGAISPDKIHLALSKSINTNDSDIYLYNTVTRQLTKINDNLSGNSPAAFSVDGSELYYLTDDGAEFQYLMKYSLSDGTKTEVMKEDWDISYAYFSDKGTYRVTGINQDAHTVIKIFNTKTSQYVITPDIGEGEITSVDISDSENLMTLYAGSSDSPSNLYLYNIDSKELKQLTNTLNPEINGEDLVKGQVIRFESYDGLEIPAILYKPHYAGSDNKVPAIVQVHGGPGGQTRLNYSSLYQYLVNHGYAVLCVNNRGSSGYGKTFYKMDDQKHGDVDLKDIVEGKRYLARQDWVESDKIGILGGSYGGYMVMRAMTHIPEEFAVGVNIFGVTNWLRTLKSIPPWWGSFKEALYLEMGDPNTADSTRLYEISPLFHADQIKNPVMVLQGSKDPRVLQIESDEMVENIKKNNVPVEYVLFEDEGHGFRKNENQIEGWGKIMQFLDQYLKKNDFKD